MYLKVYYHPDGPQTHATVELVQANLPADMPGLEVVLNDLIGYPTVHFPENATYADYQKLQKHLQGRGFETE